MAVKTDKAIDLKGRDKAMAVSKECKEDRAESNKKWEIREMTDLILRITTMTMGITKEDNLGGRLKDQEALSLAGLMPIDKAHKGIHNSKEDKATSRVEE